MKLDLENHWFRFNKTALRSIAAGMFIGLGAAVYCSLYQESRIAGACCFSLGLLSVLAYSCYLYTGMIGLIFEGNCIDNNDYVFFIQRDQFEMKIFYKLIENLLLVFPHNLLGIMLVAEFCKENTTIVNTATILVNTRLTEIVSPSGYSVFNKAIITGICMYIAAAGWKHTKNSPLIKCVLTVLAVMVFILTGSYHVIADWFYFFVSPINIFDHRVFTFMVTVLAGNSVGSWIMHMYARSIFLCEKW